MMVSEDERSNWQLHLQRPRRHAEYEKYAVRDGKTIREKAETAVRRKNLRVKENKTNVFNSSTWLRLVGLNELSKVHGIDARGTRIRNS